jgi:hypothetical protein
VKLIDALAELFRRLPPVFLECNGLSGLFLHTLKGRLILLVYIVVVVVVTRRLDRVHDGEKPPDSIKQRQRFELALSPLNYRKRRRLGSRGSAAPSAEIARRTLRATVAGIAESGSGR